jgi:aryl-alcohol dehydrogenase-like predicted oxidoreductase
VVKAGKARYIGASSMWSWQFAKTLHIAERNGWTRFVSMQNHYNLVYREEEREMLPLCREEGIGVIPWSPLARGFLAGNRRREDLGETARAKTDDIAQRLYYSDADFRIVDRVVELANARGVKPAQIALAWLLHQPAVSAPIVGASKMEQLEQAIAALDITLGEEERRALEEPYEPHTVRW